MSTTMSPKFTYELLQRWKRQVGVRRDFRREPRHLAAVGYFATTRVDNGFVSLKRFMLTLLHDVDVVPITTRFAGYRARFTAGQIEWGGAEYCTFDKDLSLYPARAAVGARIHPGNGDFLEFALRLDRRLERHYLRFAHMPRRHLPRFPDIWAAATQYDFRGSVSTPIRYCRRRRLVPVEKVLDRPELTTDLFVDLRSIPKVQVVALSQGLDSLRGKTDRVAFDLAASRFRQLPM